MRTQPSAPPGNPIAESGRPREESLVEAAPSPTCRRLDASCGRRGRWAKCSKFLLTSDLVLPMEDDRPSDGAQTPMRRREMVALSTGALASAVLYACGAGGRKATGSAAQGGATRPQGAAT